MGDPATLSSDDIGEITVSGILIDARNTIPAGEYSADIGAPAFRVARTEYDAIAALIAGLDLHGATLTIGTTSYTITDVVLGRAFAHLRVREA